MGDKWLKLFKDATRNKADFMLDGAAYFDSVIQAIEDATSAEHYIYILGWMLEVDFKLVEHDASKTLYDVLRKAAARGVEIRILIWDNLLPGYSKSAGNAVERLNKLPNTKAMVDEHTFYPDAAKQFIRQFAPLMKEALLQIGKILGDSRPEVDLAEVEVKGVSINFILYHVIMLLNAPTIGAHHEKVVVVKNAKGLIGFCGGIDFNSNRVLSEIFGRKHWVAGMHDNACRLEGPAAHALLQRFKRRWHRHPTADRTALCGEDEPMPAPQPAASPYAKVVGTFNSVDGRVKERSLRDAYMKIIDNAETFIYIEDQYLVNVEVAKVLNRKVQQKRFLVLFLAIQDSKATMDIAIPNRKRGEFMKALMEGVSESDQKKIVLAAFDRSGSELYSYHPQMHAKTLIVDDEIAIIGSANVNRRGFTNDSETCVIVFDDTAKNDNNFARRLRIATWKEFLRNKYQPRFVYESPYNYPMEISGRTRIYEPDGGNDRFSILVKYRKDNALDYDERLIRRIKKSNIAGVMAAGVATGNDLQRTTELLSNDTVRNIFDQIWDHLIDPIAPD